MLSRASDADNDALQALFSTPAPNLEAAIYKAELVNDGAGNGLHHVLGHLRCLCAKGC